MSAISGRWSWLKFRPLDGMEFCDQIICRVDRIQKAWDAPTIAGAEAAALDAFELPQAQKDQKLKRLERE